MRKPVRIHRASGREPASARPATPPAAPVRSVQGSALSQGCGVVLAIFLVLFLVGKCSSESTNAPVNSTQAAVSEPAFVAARSLNCRREPDISAAVAEGLTRNDQVVVAERRGQWARLTRVGGDCWVFSSFLAGSPGISGASDGSATKAHGLMPTGMGSTVATAGASYIAGKTVRSGKRHAGSKRRSTPRGSHSSGDGYSGRECPCSGSHG